LPVTPGNDAPVELRHGFSVGRGLAPPNWLDERQAGVRCRRIVAIHFPTLVIPRLLHGCPKLAQRRNSAALQAAAFATASVVRRFFSILVDATFTSLGEPPFTKAFERHLRVSKGSCVLHACIAD
jgi:hypothetical protein